MVSPKEYKVPDLQPISFIIEILDNEQKPITRVQFNIAIDGGDEMTKETDSDGVIKVPKPKSEIKLSLAGEEASTPSEESD